MSNMQFADPYSAQKILSGVIRALNDGQPKRPNWLQSFYPTNAALINDRTVNFDQQLSVRNVMGTFALPNADVNPVSLPTYGHKEHSFSYAKESVTDGDDDFETLNMREMGQQFGQPNIAANMAMRLNAKFAAVEQRFENLFELVASQILLYGGYGAKSEYYPLYVYDFERSVCNKYSDIKTDKDTLVSSVNLTTSPVTAPWDASRVILPVIASAGAAYTAGEKAWTKANVDAGTATPYKDLLQMILTCNEWSRADMVHMSQDAYEVFNYDIEKNYKEAAVTTTLAMLQIERDILPRMQSVDDLHFQRSISLGGGINLPIYTYKAIYHNRNTGERTRYIGNGWVSVIPNSGYVKAYGRIMHRKANYSAMPRWINSWMDEKTGVQQWEWHTNFVMANSAINSLVTWKVA